MCGLALFFTKKRTNCTYSHHTPNHQTPICRARLHDVQRWNLRSSETFYFAQVRTLEYVLAYQRTVCEKHAGILGRHLWGSCNSCKKRQCLLLYIYIYISLNWKFRWARNTSNVRNASSAHPFIGFSNLICLWANSTTTNRCSSMIAVKPTNDGESAPCQITRRKETSCQGRSTLYILGINSSHL